MSLLIDGDKKDVLLVVVAIVVVEINKKERRRMVGGVEKREKERKQKREKGDPLFYMCPYSDVASPFRFFLRMALPFRNEKKKEMGTSLDTSFSVGLFVCDVNACKSELECVCVCEREYEKTHSP